MVGRVCSSEDVVVFFVWVFSCEFDFPPILLLGFLWVFADLADPSEFLVS
jgi:hypothetical protein